MTAAKAPGLAIAVIEHGEVTFAHGFGTRTPGKTEPVKPSSFAADLSTFPALAGTYNDPYGVGDIVVGWDGTKLTVKIDSVTKQGASVGPYLTPVTPNDFVYDLAGEPDLATFILDDKGNPEYFRSRLFVGHRAPPTSSQPGAGTGPGAGPSPLPPAPLDADALVGRAKRNAPAVRHALAILPRAGGGGP